MQLTPRRHGSAPRLLLAWATSLSALAALAPHAVAQVEWTLRSLPLPPFSYRSEFAFAYDEYRDAIVIFGGRSGNVLLDETWTLDVSSGVWLPIATPIAPTARTSAALVYDSARRRCVLFGGAPAPVGGMQQYLGDTWFFDGANWIPASPATSPAPRYGHAMAYDAGRDRVCLVAGTVTAEPNT